MLNGENRRDRHPLLGIDLGTSNTRVARFDSNRVEICRNKVTDKTATPSVICRKPETGEFHVGRSGDLANTLAGVKRRMDTGSEQIPLGDAAFTPIELSAVILKQVCELTLAPGVKPRGALVTAPYQFKLHQRENTRRAVEEAGIPCAGIIQDPLAACLSYAWNLAETECHETILVFDLGGGTLDIALIKMDLTPENLKLEVHATGGDDRLGGMDFDDAVVALIVRKAEIDLDSLSPIEREIAERKLRSAAIEARESLGTLSEWHVVIADVVPGSHVEITVSSTDIDEAIRGHLDRIEAAFQDIYRQWTETARLAGDSEVEKSAADVDRVLQVGGASRTGGVAAMLMEMFGEQKICQGEDTDSAVAAGASLYAAYRDDPAEFDRKITLVTRMAHALGIKTANGEFVPLIRRNRRVPSTAKQLFRLAEDNMAVLRVDVYQGSDNMAIVEESTRVGAVVIDITPPCPKGTPVTVTFSISQEHTLSVTVELAGYAKDAVVNYE